MDFLGDVFMPKPVDMQVDLDSTVVLNLEYPITDYEKGYPGKINLKAKKNHLRHIFKNRKIIVNLANNHILDYGEKGFYDTIESLEKENIYYFGSGFMNDNFNNPLIIDINEYTYAFIGYAHEDTSPVFGINDKPGAARLKLENIKKDIACAKNAGADFVICSLHWGAENISIPHPKHQNIAYNIIDLGADLIIGHHAHCIQPIERYKGKVICYGLGNTIMSEGLTACNYDKNGLNCSYRFIKLQKWNKESLIVNYSFKNDDVNFYKGRFNNEVFRITNKSFSPNQIKRLSMKRFRFEYFKGKMRENLYKFYQNPKMIKKNHFKSFYNLVLPQQFR